MVGGATGWFRFGAVALSADTTRYSATLSVQDTSAGTEKNGVLSVHLGITDGALAGTLTWLESVGFAADCVSALYEDGIVCLYIKTEDVTERIRVAVSGESNNGTYTSLMTTENNSAPESSTARMASAIRSTKTHGIVRRTAGSADSFSAADGVHQVLTAQAEALTVVCPNTPQECGALIRVTLAEGGSIADFTGALTYTGDAYASAAPGEVWEFSVLDGNVVGKKLATIQREE